MTSKTLPETSQATTEAELVEDLNGRDPRESR